ncbi:MAG: family 1 glycosylhydrolase [Verrucomicrobiota bacterium]
MPEGTGAINRAGLDFYDALVDALLAADIEPWVTLFHWDYPYALFLRGGWLNPESPKWFAEYTRAVVNRLSDRVRNWITLNEPQCYLGLGHLTGEHAPGLRLGLTEALLAGHHSLMAHGLAVEVIRAWAKQKPRVGWAPVTTGYYPNTNSPADIEAARALACSVSGRDFWNNTWWGDPPLLGPLSRGGSACLWRRSAEVFLQRLRGHPPAARLLRLQHLHRRAGGGGRGRPAAHPRFRRGPSQHAVALEGGAGGHLLGAEVPAGALRPAPSS